MTMVIACAKGCGVGIKVDDETIQDFIKRGEPLQVAHDVCPTESKDVIAYRFVIEVYRETHFGGDEVADVSEKVASVGATVEAPTFTQALPNITKKINEQWEKVNGMAQVIDQG